jgi:hypothetical protein
MNRAAHDAAGRHVNMNELIAPFRRFMRDALDIYPMLPRRP